MDNNVTLLLNRVDSLEKAYPPGQVVRVKGLGNMTWEGVVELAKAQSSVQYGLDNLSPEWLDGYEKILAEYVRTTYIERE